MAGKIIADTIETGAGADISTSYVVNGSAKLRIEFSGDQTTINSSFNVSSLADDATGKATVNITSAFSDARYVPTGSSAYTSASSDYRQYLASNYQSNLDETRSTTDCSHGIWESSFIDAGSSGYVYFGDLA